MGSLLSSVMCRSVRIRFFLNMKYEDGEGRPFGQAFSRVSHLLQAA